MTAPSDSSDGNPSTCGGKFWSELTPPKRSEFPAACTSCQRGLLEDLCGAIAARHVDLVRPHAVGLLVEVDEEVRVERVAAIGLPVELGEPALDPLIELVVPGREQRVRYVHAIAVERVLQHLRPAV